MTTKRPYRDLSSEQLYAFELEVRRLRAQALADALKKAASAIKGLFARPAPAPRARTVRHA